MLGASQGPPPRWLSAALWAALSLGPGCGDGTGDDPGDGPDARPDGGVPRVDGGVGEPCEAVADCVAVAYPECTDLGDEGVDRCQSICANSLDCSANASCIVPPGAAAGDGLCLQACAADADCFGNWDCVLDQAGIGFCLPRVMMGDLPLNAACEEAAECAATFGTCADWGDGVFRCAGRCLDHIDCGGGATLCVQVDGDDGEALCFAECAAADECPEGWTCEAATESGRMLCLPPPL